MSKRRADGRPVTRRPNKPKKTAGQRARGILKKLAILGVVGLLILSGILVVLYQAIAIPEPNEAFKAQTTFVYYSGGDEELGTYYDDQNRESIPLSEMPQTMQDAVVAAENRTFWTDNGIDPKGILRAAFSNARGNAQQGASTITQQYVKILYLTSERSYQRKIKEAVVSLKIRNQLSKEEILEGYLNTIYFGRGAYGIQAAAQAFFGHDAKDLSLRESAVLATTLNNPSTYDPDNGKAAKQALKERYRYVLSGMADMGTISDAEAEKAAKRLPKFPEIAQQSQFGGQRGHMLALVKKELLSLGFDEQEIDGGGLRVTTTFTKAAMASAEEGVMEAKPEGFGDKELHIGAATVEVGTGALRGFYGGQDYLDSQINWAATGGMAGSTIKPLTIAAALKDGFSLKDSFEGNSPYEFPDGLEVNNEGPGDGNDYGSAVSLVTAAEESINTAFIDMSDSMDDGPEKIYDMARALGIPGDKPSPKFPGIPNRTVDFTPDDTLITLGKGRVSPINMANAYATIANGGERSDVHVVERVVDASGEERYSYKQKTRRAVDEDIAADTSYAMQQVVANGTGQAALALGRPAAGKTGTATGGSGEDPYVSSSWFAGYTPQMATAVMYVRGDGDNQLDGWLPSYFGADYPADTWTAIMSSIMDGMDVEDFPEPAYVDGDAPSSGHEPYVPPATSTNPPPPPPKPTKSATIKTQEPEPTQTPSTPVPTTPVPTTPVPTTPVPTTPVPTEPVPTTPVPTTPLPTETVPPPTVAPSRAAGR
ncbi:transglycosylase domain-containing protein [Nocardioides currus]|uniref:transglycosylase domain-containing protein n=1 Tax=Nocardioides currus TaxID=2133958 RepID=UPI001FAF301C|nr:transglycosylase domain-containing protein [Nocardioides currus]